MTRADRHRSGERFDGAPTPRFPGERLFVYGTLLFPEVVEALLDRRFEARRARLLGYRRVFTRRRDGGARGPAIVEDPSATVEGAVLFDIDAAAQTVLDRFESAAAGYERRIVHVEMEHESRVAVAAYVGTEAMHPYLTDRRWVPELFRENGLSHYVRERIPQLRRKWAR